MKTMPDIERAFGKIALLTDKVEALTAEVQELREAREHDAQRIQFLSAQVERAGQLPEVLNVKEAAAALNVSIRTLKAWTAEGRIQSVSYPGRFVRYQSEEIQRFLKGAERKRALKAA